MDIRDLQIIDRLIDEIGIEEMLEGIKMCCEERADEDASYGRSDDAANWSEYAFGLRNMLER